MLAQIRIPRATAWLMALLVFLSAVAIGAEYDYLDRFDTGGLAFREVLVGDRLVSYFHQRMIGEAMVSGDYIVYVFDRESGELIAHRSFWRDDLPDSLPDIPVTAEDAALLAGGEFLRGRLAYIPLESPMYRLHQAPTNPCWIVRHLVEGNLTITIVDAIDGTILGNGVPPPDDAFTLTGPTSEDPCAGDWGAYYQDAASWFRTMGFTAEAIRWPTEGRVREQLRTYPTMLFYELAHGSSERFASGCENDRYERTYASEIEYWLSGSRPMAFAFIGSCDGMCSTGDGTLSYEFRQGQDDNVVTVGYCGMSGDDCEDCWYNHSLDWQGDLFDFLSQGETAGDAFDLALALHAPCADNACMRFAGDRLLHLVGHVYLVNSSGTGDYPDIQTAIDGAVPNSEIWLADGVYTGSGNRNLDFRAKTLTLKSISGNPEDCVIDCQNVTRGFKFRADDGLDTVVEGITIRNGWTWEIGGGVYCSFQSSPTIRNCIFENNNSAEDGGGLGCDWMSTPNVVGCVFEGNHADRNGGGAYCDNSDVPFEDCIFRENTADQGAGGLECFESDISVSNCVFLANEGYGTGGLACVGGSAPTVTSCTFSDNVEGGILCLDGAHMDLRKTIIAFSVNSRAFYIDDESLPSYLRCCDFYGNVGNWVGDIADSLGQHGNIYKDPLFCGRPDDLTLCEDSPCLVASGECSPQIGAYGQGCLACGNFVCCVGGDCYVFTYETDCIALSGEWHDEWDSCDENPCEAACCVGLDCHFVTEAECVDLGGAWHPEATTCSPNPCPAVCCNLEEDCWLASYTDCINSEGYWYPDLDSCDGPNPCLLRACCEGESCVLSIESECDADWFPGENSCEPNPCISPTAPCCIGETCQILIESECTGGGGSWYPGWENCDGNPCDVAVCCDGDQECSETLESACGGTWYSELDDCGDLPADNPCLTGVCCIGDECSILIEHECTDLGGTFFESWDTCEPNPCLRRACCEEGAECTIARLDECDAIGGTWLADVSYCDPNPCQAMCCVDTTCYIVTAADCEDLGGRWFPMTESCDNPYGSPCPAVCCYGEGQCTVTPVYQCENLGGTPHPDGYSCEPNPCRHVVCPDGSGDYATIQEAINAAAPTNDVIALTNGVFHVSVHRYDQPYGMDYLGKAITIYSLSGDRERCIIDCDSTYRAFNLQMNEGPGSVLRGVTIRNGYGMYGGGINVTNASPTIVDCVFEDNRADYGGGLAFWGSCYPGISGCDFIENYARYEGGAIWATYGAFLTPSQCGFVHNNADGLGGAICCASAGGSAVEAGGLTFFGNAAPNGGAIYLQPGTICQLDSTIIAFGLQGGSLGVADSASSVVWFECTDIFGNMGGDWIGCFADQLGQRGNISEDPLFCNAPDELTLCWNSPCAPGFLPPFECGLMGAYGIGCGVCGGSPSDLDGGVLIAHHPAGLEYGMGQDWCQRYFDEFAITDCDEQNNRIDAAGDTLSVWYVLAAWHEAKEFCEVEFGLGEFEGQFYNIIDWGPCFPGNGIETPTSGWPGAHEGVTLNVLDTWWSGNYVPVYWFAGYAYGEELVPLDIHPLSGFAGTQSCTYPAQVGDAECLGAMGLLRDGIYCCPQPPEYAACCVDGVCSVTTADGCDALGGTWYPQWLTCDGDPCPGVCCVAGDCSITTTGECTALTGVWHGEWDSCDPNPCPAACCVDGVCTLVRVDECEEGGGIWHGEWDSCDPNPCPAACCIEEACVLTTGANCDSIGGIWYPAWDSCAPNPCLDPIDWADHDVGECVLTMTDQGIIGFMDGNQTAGSGFIYPQGGINLLWVGSLWVGESETYVANRDYDADPAREWMLSSDPDGHVWIDENGTSHQDIHSCYTDSGAVSPRNLFVDQESWAYALNSVARDFVIIRYTLRNDGASILSDLYAGCFMDFDLSSPYTYDWGAVDAGRDLAYMTDSSGVHVGARLLQAPGDPPVANVTLIPNVNYVWPSSYILDPDKYGFLSGGPGYVVTAPDSLSDYSVLVSGGPLTLMPAEERLIAFAIIGGRDLAELELHADVAQLLYTDGFGDVPEEEADQPVRVTCLRPNAPNPFSRDTVVRFDLARSASVQLCVFDPTGRLVRTLTQATYASGRHALSWDCRTDDGRTVPAGVYFLRMRGAGEETCRRMVVLR